MSILLVCWGEDQVHGIFPKGGAGGLERNDYGEVTVQGSTGIGTSRLRAYQEQYVLTCGLAVPDWRYVVRIANIDKSALTADASAGANLPDLMFEATEIIPNLSMGRPAWYMARDIRTKLRQQTANGVSSSTLTMENVGGVRTTMFNEIPIRRCDALSADETLLT